MDTGEAMRNLVELSGAVFADALSALGIPVNTLSSALGAYIRRNAQDARTILLEELREGKLDALHAANEDEALAVIYRYLLAARDGVARRNLRLLARVIVGLAARDRLFADEFNKYAESLSRLSRDEILVIGRLHRYRKEAERRQGPTVGTGQYWPKFLEELVPKQFPTEEHVIAICCAGMRSGLIVTPRDFDSTGMYATSPIMDEVTELADFQEVLKAEDEMPDAGA
jgi:hypothetical protein